MNGSVWHKQVAAFQDTHRVVTVDMAGFGKSAGRGDESFADHARAIDGLLAHLGITDATLVGWSMGGAVGQVMGQVAPARRRRLVLVDTTPQLVADSRFEHALPPQGVQELGELFAADFPAACAAFAHACAAEDAATAAFLAEVMKGTNPQIGLAALAMGGGASLLDILDQIRVETHVIHGAEDGVCLPAAGAYLADHIGGSVGPVVLIEGAGHAPFLSREAEFNAALRKAIG